MTVTSSRLTNNDSRLYRLTNNAHERLSSHSDHQAELDGDVVHALPTLSALRSTFPSASITWLVKRQWAGLLERAEELDRVWPVATGFGGWLSQVPRLREANFDLVVDFKGCFVAGQLPG